MSEIRHEDDPELDLCCGDPVFVYGDQSAPAGDAEDVFFVCKVRWKTCIYLANGLMLIVMRKTNDMYMYVGEQIRWFYVNCKMT